MRGRFPWIIAAGGPLALAVAAASCAASAAGGTGTRPHTAADVHFMAGMIRHHQQAVRMAEWAPTHGASEAVRVLAERMVVSQRDEIALMERWLRDRRETVPDAEPAHDHGMPSMPGMLAPEQLSRLDRTRGHEFDRLFLTLMIQHHQGAITMVNQLFRAPGAAQEETVFRFAADVNADQIAEIDRMNRMLADLSPGGS